MRGTAVTVPLGRWADLMTLACKHWPSGSVRQWPCRSDEGGFTSPLHPSIPVHSGPNPQIPSPCVSPSIFRNLRDRRGRRVRVLLLPALLMPALLMPALLMSSLLMPALLVPALLMPALLLPKLVISGRPRRMPDLSGAGLLLE